MKSALCILVLLAATSSAFAFPGGSVRVLLEILIRDNKLKIDTTKECGTVVAAKKGDSLNLGQLLAFLVEKVGYGERAAIRPECDEKNKLTVCTLWFATGAGTPEYWRTGLRFDYERATKKIVATSVDCVTGN
jgi:hypothetical protein